MPGESLQLLLAAILLGKRRVRGVTTRRLAKCSQVMREDGIMRVRERGKWSNRGIKGDGMGRRDRRIESFRRLRNLIINEICQIGSSLIQ